VNAVSAAPGLDPGAGFTLAMQFEESDEAYGAWKLNLLKLLSNPSTSAGEIRKRTRVLQDLATKLTAGLDEVEQTAPGLFELANHDRTGP
jgi:hypothetical protein